MVELSLPKNSQVTKGKTYPAPKDCKRPKTFKVYRWYASHGYQTSFKPVEHLAIKVIRHSDQKTLITKSTTSQKTKQEWRGHWATQFSITI